MYGLKLKYSIEDLLSDGRDRTAREIVEDLGIDDRRALPRVRSAANKLAELNRIQKKQIKTRLKTNINIYTNEKTNDQSSFGTTGRSRRLEEYD